MKSEDQKQTQEAEPEPLYSWIFHPAKASWLVSTLLTVFLFLLLIMVYWLTQSRLFTLIGTVVLVGSMRSFYFPTEYKLFDDRIEVLYTISSLKKSWDIYRRVYPEKNGVFLSTFTRPTRMENFRGLFVKYGEADRERILEIIQNRIGKKLDEREDVSASSFGGAE